MNKPLCKWCHKPLRRYSHGWHERKEIPADATVSSVNEVRGREWGRYQLPGEYGVNGESQFCTLYHGYRFAVEIMKTPERRP